MADLRAYQPSFTAGELSPALGARVDLAKYSTGLRTAINLFIHPHGGASNRAGTEFVTEVKNSADTTRLIPFEFNTEQTYRLEFGDKYFRVIRDGGLILKDGSPYEVVTPYAHGDVFDLNFVQDADVMYICHPDYKVHKVSRLADDSWSIEEVSFAPKTARPTNLSGSRTYRSEPSDPVTMQYVITAVGSDGAESAVSVARGIEVKPGSEGRTVRLTFDLSTGATLYRVYARQGSFGSFGLIYEGEGSPIYVPQSATSGLGAPPSEAAAGAPATPTNFNVALAYGFPIKYVVSAVDADTGEESLPSDPVSIENALEYQGNTNRLSWTAVPGASAYIVYKESNGVYGYIGRTETTFFTDNNITADISDTPQTARNPFDGEGNYPRVPAFVEQRLALASTKNDPQAVWMSQTANYQNFGVSSPAKPNDAVTFRIRSQRVNEIRSMIAVKGLMVLTSGGEWVISGGSESDAITPSSLRTDNHGYRGSAKVQPIIVGNTILFSQGTGNVVRDFSYDFATNSYDGKDLTILARHMFEGRTIKSWAYAQSPYSMAWAVLDNGKLCSLTYMKEHDVWAWTRHESACEAIFEDVTVTREGLEDVPYFVVKRKVDGEWKRYVERLHTRDFETIEDAFFVDCGLTYEGNPATVITGLDHLKGETVVALADGNVVRNLTVGEVTGGVGVTLPNAASKVNIGLPMVASLETMNLDLGQVQGLGTVQGREKSVSEVTLRVERTRGIFIGPYDGDRESKHLVEYKQRSTEAWGEAIRLYTGDISITPQWDWNKNGRMWVKQFDPLPMTILAIMPDVTIGR
jgi:hypothetical protein